MPDDFVPLPPPRGGSRDTSFSSIRATASAGKSTGAADAACSKPVVTLQRNGDTVSSIRIQCGCGQIMELACVYSDVPPPTNTATLSQN